MIGSALDKLGNSQPPKFADLSAPGSSPTGVSCVLIFSCVFSYNYTCTVKHVKCSCQEIKLKVEIKIEGVVIFTGWDNISVNSLNDRNNPHCSSTADHSKTVKTNTMGAFLCYLTLVLFAFVA